jgi:hypothetical protein
MAGRMTTPVVSLGRKALSQWACCPNGKTYDGKGSRERSQESGRRVEEEAGDKHTATDWTPAANPREAFKQESQRLDSNGGAKSDSNYNKNESPGKKMLQEDAKRQ